MTLDDATLVSGVVARAAIAHAWLGSSSPPEPALGDIVLAPHQLDAVDRLRTVLARDRGALLADPVGLGKTFVALALARESPRPLIVAPAALRMMWGDAMRRTGFAVPFVSLESLSRRNRGLPNAPELLVVDEAHQARNVRTRRWNALAALAARARVLLVSATPVHNRRADLVALLSLFLGAEAGRRTDDELARCVVRRTTGSLDMGNRPNVLPVRRLGTGDDPATLRALLELAPPVPPADGGLAHALVVHGLLRQWASSQAALRAALDRRLARALALEAALSDGRHPTDDELRAWSAAEGAVQLAFPELMGSVATHPELLHAVRAHAESLRAVRRTLDRVELDAARGLRLGEVCGAHAGEKVVAFTHSADTALGLFARLRGRVRSAALTARGALVAGGRLTRREAIARFAPHASGVPPPSEAERIDLLIATDLLSEGVNLQDASVVVHLDRPWTAARLEQRVGRVARLGSAHAHVSVYELAPPAAAELLLRTEALLAEKVRAAARLIGAPEVALSPSLAGSAIQPSATADAESIHARMRRWLGATPRDCQPPLVACVRGGTPALLVAARLTTVVLGARLGDSTLMCAPRQVDAVAALAEGADAPVDRALLHRSLVEARTWLDSLVARRDAGIDSAAGAAVRRAALERISTIVRAAPPHRRPSIAALAAAARAAVAGPMSAGLEHELVALVQLASVPEDWLRAVAELDGARHRSASPAPTLIALIVVVP